MMGNVTGKNIADGKSIQRPFPDRADEAQLFIGQGVEPVLGGAADVPELFQQILPAPAGAPSFAAQSFSSQPGAGSGPGGTDEVRGKQIPVRRRQYAAAPGGSSIYLPHRHDHTSCGGWLSPASGIVWCSSGWLAEIVVFDQIDIGLIEICRDDLGPWDHGV